MRLAGRASVKEAEARGVYEALRLIQEMQYKQVIIECDSSLVVNALKRRAEYFLEVGNVLEECDEILQLRKERVIFHVKKREMG